ncbi:MAG TPA: glycosyltransferase [Micromonosporaceae bacterium]|nr:glycosyltransferase [Micromonosporaceae bacterium]
MTGPSRQPGGGTGRISVVVPTVGRASLRRLLAALAPQLDAEGGAVDVTVVDDRGGRQDTPLPGTGRAAYLRVVRGRGAGPAAARNAGWRAARGEWVAFLDDDVVPAPDWLRRLRADLDTDPDVGGVQGRVDVPLPRDRAPTDWERNTAGLADGAWVTADMAYRRAALAEVGGFDERFPRAYREDAELAYRVRRAGWRLVRGQRRVCHPVRAEDAWVSLRVQRGNADDALLRRLYGPQWRALLGLGCGRRRRHAAVTLAALVAAASLVASAAARPGPGRRRLRAAAVLAGSAWYAGTAELAIRRIAPGPGTLREVAVMVVTSILLPPLAVAWWMRGWWTARQLPPYLARGAAVPDDVCPRTARERNVRASA